MRVETGSDFSFNIPPPPDGETTPHAEVLQQSLAQYSSSIKSAEKRAATFRALAKERGSEVLPQLARLREYRRKQRATLFGLSGLAGRELDLDRIKAARSEAVAKMRAMSQDSGLDHRALRAAADKVSNRFKRRLRGRLSLTPSDSHQASH